MEEFLTNKNNKIIKILSELESIDGTHKEINIILEEDGTPRALAFFDIDKTLAELKDIHGKAIKVLFKEVFDKEFEGIEDVYFMGFRLGNSFREFDRMNCIYSQGITEYIDPDVYIKYRLNSKIKEIDSEGSEEHKIAKMYLDRYADIASDIADKFFKENKEEFEISKIKPVFALAKFYQTLGVPMFGMTANGEKFVKTISKYLGLSDIFIDIATDEDMVGGGKEKIIPKLIKSLEDKGIKISKEKLVIVGDSLFGDIGSGYRYREGASEIFIKGILVMKDMDEFNVTKEKIANSSELRKIIKNTDTEAFILDKVKLDNDKIPKLYSGNNDFLIKL